MQHLIDFQTGGQGLYPDPANPRNTPTLDAIPFVCGALREEVPNFLAQPSVHNWFWQSEVRKNEFFALYYSLLPLGSSLTSTIMCKVPQVLYDTHTRSKTAAPTPNARQLFGWSQDYARHLRTHDMPSDPHRIIGDISLPGWFTASLVPPPGEFWVLARGASFDPTEYVVLQLLRNYGTLTNYLLNWKYRDFVLRPYDLALAIIQRRVEDSATLVSHQSGEWHQCYGTTKPHDYLRPEHIRLLPAFVGQE